MPPQAPRRAAQRVVMTRKILRSIGIWAICGVLLANWSIPAQAISISEEEQLSREFLKVLKQRFELIEDPLISDYVNRVGRKLLAGLGSQPFTYRFYVVKEEVYNAFAIPAGHIFIHSGLLMAMDSEEELAGILAHEISHVVARHISQRIDRSTGINMVALAGIVAGIFLGAMAGDAAAAQGLIFGSAAAGQSLSLAYSREDEAQADQLGLACLARAGYSAAGLLDMLKKIRARQWFGSDLVPTYLMTHPAVEQRIVDIDGWMASHAAPSADPLKEKKSQAVFNKVTLRLRALYGEPGTTQHYFKTALAQDPSNAALAYGYGLLLGRLGRRAEAESYLRRAMTQDALDPIILGDLGRNYFLDGRYEEAARVLQGAVSLPGGNPDSHFFLGRTYMETGRHEAAAESFETLLRLYPDYPRLYYFLGEAYGRIERLPEAHYFLGMYAYDRVDYQVARYHLLKAEEMIQDPDRLSAVKRALEDIRKTPRTIE
jgi:predicted Zn-dependent protease